MPRVWTPGQGPRLKRFRNAIGLSQEALAERLDVSWITVWRRERPDHREQIRAVPVNIMRRLTVIYGVTMAQLIPGYTPALEG